MASKNLGEDWSERLAIAVGEQVRRLRERPGCGLSAQKLADLTAEMGHEVKRTVISNLENGRRVNVTIADVFILAAALGVPPATLVFPMERGDETVEALPGRWVRTWDAVRWWSGRTPLSSDADDLSPEQRARVQAEREYFELAGQRLAYEDNRDVVTRRRKWLASPVVAAVEDESWPMSEEVRGKQTVQIAGHRRYLEAEVEQMKAYSKKLRGTVFEVSDTELETEGNGGASEGES